MVNNHRGTCRRTLSSMWTCASLVGLVGVATVECGEPDEASQPSEPGPSETTRTRITESVVTSSPTNDDVPVTSTIQSQPPPTDSVPPPTGADITTSPTVTSEEDSIFDLVETPTSDPEIVEEYERQRTRFKEGGVEPDVRKVLAALDESFFEYSGPIAGETILVDDGSSFAICLQQLASSPPSCEERQEVSLNDRALEEFSALAESLNDGSRWSPWVAIEGSADGGSITVTALRRQTRESSERSASAGTETDPERASLILSGVQFVSANPGVETAPYAMSVSSTAAEIEVLIFDPLLVETIAGIVPGRVTIRALVVSG